VGQELDNIMAHIHFAELRYKILTDVHLSEFELQLRMNELFLLVYVIIPVFYQCELFSRHILWGK
jgi:hypothetical protein